MCDIGRIHPVGNREIYLDDLKAEATRWCEMKSDRFLRTATFERLHAEVS